MDINEQELLVLLASMDEWLGNSEGLMIEDVIEWRDQLATALQRDRLEAFQRP